MALRISLTILAIFLLIAPQHANNAPFFHSVKARSGDGVISLLRKYDLEKSDCNLHKFYELNGLKKGAHLHKNEKYIIPVYVYNYNGQSIRSTIGIGDWDKAIRIKAYNEKLYDNGLRKTHYTKSKLLWVPYHELGCELNDENIKSKSVDKPTPVSVASNESKNVAATSKPKSSGKTINEPLFGKHNKVSIVNQNLKNKVFYLVSGHGGPDPGARCTSCPNTLCEDEYAYDVTLRIARELMSQGAIVHTIIQDPNDGIRDEAYLKCDKDEICINKDKIPLDQKKRLHQRVNAINKMYDKYKKRGVKDQVTLVVHVDSRGKNSRQDVFFYHYEHSKTSKKIAKEIQNTFRDKYELHQKGRGYEGYVSCRNLYMVRNTLPPAVYVELANIRNPKDQKRLLLDSNREALAQWLCEGLIKGIQ